MLTCFYSPELYLPLPMGHPFPMHKFPMAKALIHQNCVIPEKACFKETQPLSRKTLETVHTPDYLDAIEQLSLSQYDLNRIGLPRHPRLFRRSNFGAAGTVAAAKHAVNHRYAASLAGGTHHAFADRGHGFCVFNDVALAIRALQVEHPDWQFLIVDTDAHQGNGTHAIFAQEPQVFTYSIHVGKNFPAKKELGDRDVPLPRYASPAAYFDALETSLSAVFQQTEPDCVFWIAGADVHKDDRFGQLMLSMDDIARRERIVLELIKSYNTRAVILYGGGYNKHPGMTAAIHAQTVNIAASALY